MDPETCEIFYERSVHFEENCPALASSTPLSSSFMESDSGDSDLEDESPLQHQQTVEDIPPPSSLLGTTNT